jgi:hypothetical protein
MTQEKSASLTAKQKEIYIIGFLVHVPRNSARTAQVLPAAFTPVFAGDAVRVGCHTATSSASPASAKP